MNSSDLTGALWRKSSRSNGQGNCVEVTFLDHGRVAMRDSKEGSDGAALVFARSEWRAFSGALAGSEFGRP